MIDIKNKLIVFTLLAVSGYLLFNNLGKTYLSHWDEAWYADISRNMAETGNIKTPVWNTRPFFEKPPLYFWFSALSYRIFSDEEFAARFFSALSGMSTIFLLYWYGVKSNHSVYAGFFSSLVLLSSPMYLYRARTGNLDVFLSFWITISIIFLILGIRKKSYLFSILSGVFTSLAFLSKGIVGLVTVGVVLFFLFTKKYTWKSFILFSIPLLSIIGGWFLWYGISNGKEFVIQFFSHQQDKIVGSQLRIGGLFTTVKIIYHGLKWWFIYYLLSVVFMPFFIKKIHFQMLGVTSIFILFSFLFVESKNNWLLIPLYPFVALLIGSFMNIVIKKYPQYKKLVLIVILATVLFQLIFYKNEYFVPDTAELDARVAKIASNLTDSRDILYITNYYYPSIVYYSKRKVYAVYNENTDIISWWIRPVSEWDAILKKDKVTVIAHDEEYNTMKKKFDSYKIKPVYHIDDRVILQKKIHEK